MKNTIDKVDVLRISNWKWKQVKTAYRKYVKNKYSEKLWHFSSEDNICASSYLNHFNDKFNVPKFNKLHVASGLSIHYSTMPF